MTSCLFFGLHTHFHHADYYKVQLRYVLTLLPLKQHLLSRLVVITKSDCLFHMLHASGCEAFVSRCCVGAAVHRPPSVSWQTWSDYINMELRVRREKGINQSMSQNQIQLLRITCWEKNNASCLFVYHSIIVSVTDSMCACLIFRNNLSCSVYMCTVDIESILKSCWFCVFSSVMTNVTFVQNQLKRHT